MSTNDTTTTTTTPTTTPASARGLTLPCPRCGEEAASISLNLADADTLTCHECEEEFTLCEMREVVKKWGRVIKWVDTMPSDEDME